MAYLEMKHITKQFGDLLALDEVCLSVEKGEIHALLGENGAGKSTLMNILYGMYKQTKGEIFLDEQKVDIKDSKTAIELGIGMVHQHFMLIPTLTAIQNVVLGCKDSEGILKLNEAAKRFIEIADSYDLKIDPWVKVANLSVGQQQRLEILKALYRKTDILILDEPTAVLTPQEVKGLFVMLNQLKKDGHTIIFITHKLVEVMEVCDRCTVLRKGQKIVTMPIKEVKSKQQLANLMVGHDVDLITHKCEKPVGNEVLNLKDLCYTDEEKVMRLKKVNFSVKSGEILGICGVDGNGQSELVSCITGLLKPSKGNVYIDGEDCTGCNPKEVLEKKVSHIPEDRLKMGMISQMNINENLILMAYDKKPYSSKGILNWKWIDEHNSEICKEYDVKTPSIKELAGKLSGGNQQKFVVGRELDRNPELLIAVYPTRGLDIGSTKYIQSRIIEQRDRGAAVLLVSTELEEVMEMSDRILVMYEGNVMGTIDQKEATREQLGLLMAGVTA